MKLISVGVQCCRAEVNNMTAMVFFKDEWYKMFHEGMEIIATDFEMSWKDGVMNFHVTQGVSRVFLCPSKERGSFNSVELFAVLGGWSHMATTMGMVPMLMVDSDENVAFACAKRLGLACMDAKSYVQKILDGHEAFRCVIHDDVQNPDTWVAISLVNPDTILGSPPCQPWSSAGTSCGLQSLDGKVFQSVLRQAAMVGVLVVVLENVPGLPRHQDFRELVGDAEKRGLKLALHGTYACAKVLPVHRDRWLGTFVHESVQFDAAKQTMANAISFADRAFEAVATSPTIRDADVSHVNMNASEKRQLTIPGELVGMLSQIEYAPQWLKNRLKGIPNPTKDHVFQARVVTDCQQFIGFMAMYGKQHTIPDDLLRSKGLQTMLFNDGTGIRYISPWEMIASMGYPSDTVLSSDIEVSWRMAGNGLSVAHAWLQLYKTHVLLGDASPFKPQGTPVQQVAAFQRNAIKMSEWVAQIQGHFWGLSPKPDMHICKKTKGSEGTGHVAGPNVPPTVPFTIQDPEDITTSGFEMTPEFAMMGDPRDVAVIGQQYGGGMVTLQHVQNNWMMFVNSEPEDVVSRIICKALPHAKPSHFQELTIDNMVITWGQTIKCRPIKVLTFCPVFTQVTCKEESLKIAMTLQADVTWTAKTAIAYSAVKIGCNPDALVLISNSLPLKDDDFLLEYERTEFQMKFKACMPGYVSWAPSVKEVHDEGMAPVPCTMKRWFSRHPTKKVVRTVCMGHNSNVLQLVQRLFPDLHATTSWTPFHDDQEIACTSVINDLQCLQIQWNGFRPLRATSISCMRHHGRAVDAPAVQMQYAGKGIKRHVRSPFKIKTDEICLAPDMTLAEVAASFMTVAQLQVSMICTVGTVVLDPSMQVQDTPTDDVITFRVCPLLGGAKTDAKSRIGEMLKSKGVPADKVEERMKGLFAKVSPEKFKMNMNDDAFWTQVKTVASENKYRLITHEELKAFQSANRKNKTKAESSEAKPKAREEQFLVDASKIVIDATHFSANDDEVGLIESTRFGPDQTGICVVNASDASKWSNNAVKSCDPLALLVVGKGCHEYGEVFSIPAHTVSGTPIIVQGCLMQFGDIPVQYNLKIPSVVVDQVASTAIEFAIYRDHVTCWNDVGVPLHYIGVHIPELRGSNLLATWSIKAWSKQQVAHVSRADHWHGFFRIADSLLHAVLSRSGVAGIFLNPKTSDRKHDPRFITIALPNGKLAEVLARAEGCPKAVGVVKRGDAYCIRCRREDADQLRAVLMPETAFVQTASFSEEEVLYVMSNVPQINRDELGQALGRAGWMANPIKPQGMKRWLVAAKHDPPTSHMGINGAIVVVEKARKSAPSAQPVTMFAREFKVDTVRDSHNNVLQVSTTSRIAEFKAQMDDQIAAAVEMKLASANARIEELQTALLEVKDSAERSHASITNDMGHMKQEQSFTRQKLQEVEVSVATSGQAIIQQMQSMFATMQTSLEKTMQQNMGGEAEKRPRTTETGRNDPFSTKET